MEEENNQRIPLPPPPVPPPLATEEDFSDFLSRYQPPLFTEKNAMEILACLPLKSVIRFRSLYALWDSPISDTLSYVRRRSNPRVLAVSGVAPFNVSSLSIRYFLKAPTNVDVICTLETRHSVVGSCNGVVCLMASASFSSYQDCTWVRFLNPATRAMTPKSPKVIASVNLGACPYVDNFGFGFDSLSSTYKVVLLPDHKRIGMRIKVFSLGSSSWRETRFSAPQRINHSRFGVHLKGNVNFLASRIPQNSNDGWPVPWVWDSDVCEVYSFDLNKEQPLTFSLPNTPMKLEVPNLGVLEDCLCLSHNDPNQHNFIVWQMKRFGDDGSWSQLLNIQCENLEPYHHGLLLSHLPLHFPLWLSDNGDVVMLHNGLLYNHKDNQLHLLEIPQSIDQYNAMLYDESFLSLW